MHLPVATSRPQPSPYISVLVAMALGVTAGFLHPEVGKVGERT
jgi:hypothetical protein